MRLPLRLLSRIGRTISLALSVELSYYPFIERTKKMNVTIDMDQELSKRTVAQTRNGQHYIFSLKRLKRLTGLEQLTSLRLSHMTSGDISSWGTTTSELRDLEYMLHGMHLKLLKLGEVMLTFQSSDLKERRIHLVPNRGEFVNLYLEMTSTEAYLCFTVQNDSAGVLEIELRDPSGHEAHQLSLFPS